MQFNSTLLTNQLLSDAIKTVSMYLYIKIIKIFFDTRKIKLLFDVRNYSIFLTARQLAFGWKRVRSTP